MKPPQQHGKALRLRDINTKRRLEERRYWMRRAGHALVVMLLAAMGATLGGALGLGWLMAALAAGAGGLFFGAEKQHKWVEPENPVGGEDDYPSGVLLQALPSPVLLFDQDGHAIHVNKAAAEILARTMISLHFRRIFREAGLLAAIEKGLTERQGSRLKFEIYNPVPRVLSAHVAPLDFPEAMEGDNPFSRARLMLLLDDETTRQRTAQMRSDFVANVSHELKTPLASISGFIEQLQTMDPEEVGTRDRFLSLMSAQARRMRSIITDLLSLSRIELNEHIPPTQSVQLLDVLEEAVQGFEPIISGGQAHIRNEVRDPPTLIGDQGQLVQVFTNLIMNAVQHGGEGVEITITGALNPDPESSLYDVTVADTGPGIPAEHLPRIEERFYRADVARSRESGGTGLGLAIVKHIVSRHRGFVDISSEVGKGSRFTISLGVK